MPVTREMSNGSLNIEANKKLKKTKVVPSKCSKESEKVRLMANVIPNQHEEYKPHAYETENEIPIVQNKGKEPKFSRNGTGSRILKERQNNSLPISLNLKSKQMHQSEHCIQLGVKESSTISTSLSGVTKCEICGMVCGSTGSLTQHMLTHSVEKPFSCSVCSKGFIRRKRLVEHLDSVHKGIKPYSCHLCSKTFSMQHNLKGHMTVHLSTFKYACLLCANTKYKCLRDMKKHLRRKHCETLELDKNAVEIDEADSTKDVVQTAMLPSRYSCHLCAMTFSMRHNLKGHMTVHLSTFKYACLICVNKKYKCLRDIKKHMKCKHSEIFVLDKNAVEIDEAVGNERDYLKDVETDMLKTTRSHFGKAIDYGKDIFEVLPETARGEQGHAFLGLSSKCSDEKENEIAEKTDQDNSKVDVAKQVLKQRSDLMNIERTSGAKSRKRKFCETIEKQQIKMSNYDKNTKNLINVKDGTKEKEVKPDLLKQCFRCEVCDKCFSSQGNLRTHSLVHSEKRRFICSVCGHGFNRRDRLTVHIHSVHTGYKPFICTECNKAFTTNELLKNHLVCHAKTRPFVCSHCNKSFKAKSNLAKHVKRNHTRK